MDKLDEQLKEIRRKREEEIEKARKDGTLKCLHNSCQDCKGSGLTVDGKLCIHGIACPCTKCSPTWQLGDKYEICFAYNNNSARNIPMVQ